MDRVVGEQLLRLVQRRRGLVRLPEMLIDDDFPHGQFGLFWILGAGILDDLERLIPIALVDLGGDIAGCIHHRHGFGVGWEEEIDGPQTAPDERNDDDQRHDEPADMPSPGDA